MLVAVVVVGGGGGAAAAAAEAGAAEHEEASSIFDMTVLSKISYANIINVCKGEEIVFSKFIAAQEL